MMWGIRPGPLLFQNNADLVLGLLSENSLRQSLMLSGGDPSIFFTRFITLLFMFTAILAYLTPLFRWMMKKAGYGKVDINVESL
jgi:TctA family transporter